MKNTDKKNRFEIPELVIIEFTNEDIITDSVMGTINDEITNFPSYPII